MKLALDLGINYFDTAPAYGGSISEANLGRALDELGATPILSTKVSLTSADLDDIPGAVVRSVRASMRRLRVARLPLVYLHNRVAKSRSVSENGKIVLTVADVLEPRGVAEGFDILRQNGVIDFAGCCAYGGDMDETKMLIDGGIFASIFVNYSMLNPSAWHAAPPNVTNYAKIGAYAAQAGLGTIALRVLEGGALSGTGVVPNGGMDRDAITASAARAGMMAEEAGIDLSQAAIRYCLSNPDVANVLVGFSDIAQVKSAVDAANLGPLPSPLLKRFDATCEP